MLHQRKTRFLDALTNLLHFCSMRIRQDLYGRWTSERPCNEERVLNRRKPGLLRISNHESWPLQRSNRAAAGQVRDCGWWTG